MSAGIMLLGTLAGLVAGAVALANGYGILISLAVYAGMGALSILVFGVGAFLANRTPKVRTRQTEPGLSETAPARR